MLTRNVRSSGAASPSLRLYIHVLFLPVPLFLRLNLPEAIFPERINGCVSRLITQCNIVSDAYSTGDPNPSCRKLQVLAIQYITAFQGRIFRQVAGILVAACFCVGAITRQGKDARVRICSPVFPR